MKIMRRRIGPFLFVVLCLGIGAAAAQQDSALSGVRLLVVDETKTFLATMRVGGLVGALKGIGMFDVGVRFADVEASFSDPLAGRWPDEGLEPYDVVLIVPRGIDDGTADWVWILSNGPLSLEPAVAGGIDVIRQVVGLVFEGRVTSTGVHDDLLLGLIYEAYVAKGWMR